MWKLKRFINNLFHPQPPCSKPDEWGEWFVATVKKDLQDAAAIYWKAKAKRERG